jgi:D-threonate/D-erythronate kinase
VKTIRILADDLTGALDSAAAFVGEVPVWLDRPGDRVDEGDAAVSVVATATRDVERSELEALLAPSIAWLRAADVSFKKVDSLLRGNTFAECALLGRDAARIVFAPGYPKQGRVTVEGRALRRQPGGHHEQAIVDQPLAHVLMSELAHLPERPAPEVWVPDVRDDADLDAIAAQALDTSSCDWLWCGSAGLAHALARSLGLAPSALTTNTQAVSSKSDASGVDVLLVSATRNPVLQRQWAALESALRAAAGMAFAGDSKGFRACGIAGTHLAASRPLTQPAAAAHLAQRTRAIVSDNAKPGLLVVIGGDTLLALCHAAGTRSLLASASPREGWGKAKLVGGRWGGVTCLSRSGAFGGDDDLVELLRARFTTR